MLRHENIVYGEGRPVLRGASNRPVGLQVADAPKPALWRQRVEPAPDVAEKVISLIIRRNWFDTRLKTFAITLLVVMAAISLTPARLSTQNMPVIVGRIEGDDLAVKTTTTAGIEINAGPTVVASGSDVTVNSGHALLLLD